MTEDPKGRLDILAVRLAEVFARKVEAVTGYQFWDGENGGRAVCEAKLDELGLRGRVMTPFDLAVESGFVKRPKRLKRSA